MKTSYSDRSRCLVSAIIVKQIGNCWFGFVVRRIIGPVFDNGYVYRRSVSRDV